MNGSNRSHPIPVTPRKQDFQSDHPPVFAINTDNDDQIKFSPSSFFLKGYQKTVSLGRFFLQQEAYFPHKITYTLNINNLHLFIRDIATNSFAVNK